MGNKYINRISTIADANKYLKENGKSDIICIDYCGKLHDKSICKCLMDGYEWSTSLYYVAKNGCPKCNKKGRLKTLEEVNEYLKTITKSIICIYYAGSISNKNSKFKCLIDGYEWTSSLNNITNNKRGCAVCAGIKKIKNIDEGNKWLEDNYKNFKCIDYIGNVRELSIFKCNICGKIWKSTFNNIKNGNGCPFCHCSRGEREIMKVLDTNNIYYNAEYTIDECRNINVLPFDFAFLHNGKLLGLCEYQGIQHFKPVDFANNGEEWAIEQFKKIKERDIIKKNFCITNNIPLLEIPYWEFDNIEKIILDFYNSIAA